MKSAHFGFGQDCGPGKSPSIALNERGDVLMVHEALAGEKHYRVGRLSQAPIQWGNSKPAGEGETPRVALNKHDVAVEVHRNPDHKTLYCRVARLGAGDEVVWPYGARDTAGPVPRQRHDFGCPV